MRQLLGHSFHNVSIERIPFLAPVVEGLPLDRMVVVRLADQPIVIVHLLLVLRLGERDRRFQQLAVHQEDLVAVEFLKKLVDFGLVLQGGLFGLNYRLLGILF